MNKNINYEKTHYDSYAHNIGELLSGNGTQQLTCRDKDILYMSLHRYEGGTFYPQDNHGTASYCGRGNGKGR